MVSVLSCCIGLAMLIKFSVPPIELTGDVTVTKLDVSPVRSQLAAVAESKSQTAMLRFDGVVADRQPGIIWEVYAGPRDAKRDAAAPSYVGNVALYGTGIRSEARGEFKPAHFEFPLNAAIRAARRAWSGPVFLTFVPRGVGANGAHPKPMAPVRIGSVAITLEPQEP